MPIVRALLAFAVGTARSRVSLQFVLIVLSHSRRKVLHFNVTDHPSAHWMGQQLAEAFPWETVLQWRTHLSLSMDCPDTRPVQLPYSAS